MKVKSNYYYYYNKWITQALTNGYFYYWWIFFLWLNNSSFSLETSKKGQSTRGGLQMSEQQSKAQQYSAYEDLKQIEAANPHKWQVGTQEYLHSCLKNYENFRQLCFYPSTNQWTASDLIISSSIQIINRAEQAKTEER